MLMLGIVFACHYRVRLQIYTVPLLQLQKDYVHPNGCVSGGSLQQQVDLTLAKCKQDPLGSWLSQSLSMK